MKEDEIRRLVKIVEESNIDQLEITRWGRTIKISKSSSNSNFNPSSSTTQTYHVPATQSSPAGVVEAANNKAVQSEDTPVITSKQGIEIKSPMVGTFYRAPAPDANPYVQVDQIVKKGQVLCIIEAMKLMNEIESETDGKIQEILVENGQPVEYNQPLFIIEPIEPA